MHAGCQLRGFVGVARFALHLGDVVGVRILLDVSVAVVALQAAVNANAELVAINGDAVPGGVGHGLVAVAAQAVGLRGKAMRRGKERERDEPKGSGLVALDCPGQSGQPFDWTDKDSDEERCESCGLGHAAVFPPRHVRNGSHTRGFPAADFSADPEISGGDCTYEETLFVIGLAVIGVTNAMKSKSLRSFSDVMRVTSHWSESVRNRAAEPSPGLSSVVKASRFRRKVPQGLKPLPFFGREFRHD